MAVKKVTDSQRIAEFEAQLKFPSFGGSTRTLNNWEAMCDGTLQEWTPDEEIVNDTKKLQYAKSNFLFALKNQAKKRGRVATYKWFGDIKTIMFRVVTPENGVTTEHEEQSADPVDVGQSDEGADVNALLAEDSEKHEVAHSKPVRSNGGRKK